MERDAGGPRLYTKDDLCRLAGVKPRLIDDWMTLGLVDRPLLSSRGRYGRAPGVWPETQMRLLVELVKLRPRVTRMAKLCKVPVWTWLTNEEMAIPVRQVRKALATWAKAATDRRQRAGEAEARKMARRWRQPGASGTQGPFVDAVVNNLGSGKWDGEAVARTLNALLGIKSGDQLGPDAAPISGAVYARELEIRLEAIANLHQMPDALFYEARAVYHRANASYAQQQRDLARDPAVGHLYNVRDQSDILNDACRDLVDILGLLQRARQARQGLAAG